MKHTVGKSALVGERSNFIDSKSAQTSHDFPSGTKRLLPVNAVTCVVAGHALNLSFLWVR